jgi:superfamily II DNA or RNA helicase
MNVKTMIIVHKEFLMNQWKERINQFLPDATVGILRQQKCEIKNDITIAMLQTLCTKIFDEGTFDSFGLTIIDETHHICSRVFSQSMFTFTTKYILGLSATPERKDNLTYVLHWFIGPTCFSIKRENQEGVYVHQLNFACKKYDDEPPTNIAGKVNLPEIINTIVNIESRNNLIIKLLKDSLDEKRNIILLTERRSHCEYLLEALTKELPGVNAGLYMGGMKQHVLKENENCDVLFATYSLAHEGLDIPKLDTLILATPKSDVVQSCGRILRETGTKKNNPVIYDIVDTWGPLLGQSRKRKTFYNKSGFNINKTNEEETLTKFKNCAFIDE